MSKVTSIRTLTFPKLKWSIEKGEEKELPEGKEAQEAVLAHFAISEVGGKSTANNSSKSDEKKDEKKEDK